MTTLSHHKIFLFSALILAPLCACSEAVHDIAGSDAGGSAGVSGLSDQMASGGLDDVAQGGASGTAGAANAAQQNPCQSIGDELVTILQQHAACSSDDECKIIYAGPCLGRVLVDPNVLPAESCGDRPANIYLDEAYFQGRLDELEACLGDCDIECDLGASVAQCTDGSCRIGH